MRTQLRWRGAGVRRLVTLSATTALVFGGLEQVLVATSLHQSPTPKVGLPLTSTHVFGTLGAILDV